MNFSLKLSWDDLYEEAVFSSKRDSDLIARETGLGVGNRQGYRRKYGREYRMTGCCLELWREPQINFDGRVLGCSVNYWKDYGNAFRQGLPAVITNERMQYARGMLMGKYPPRNDIPCVRCIAYQTMQKSGAWLTDEEVKIPYRPKRSVLMLQKKAPRAYTYLHSWFHSPSPDESPRFRPMKNIRTILRRTGPRLSSNVYPIDMPAEVDPKTGWIPTHFFRGSTRTLQNLSCHASLLAHGHCPHLPHEHKDEEILFLLAGEVDLVFPDPTTGEGNFRQSLKPGEFVYYPRFFSHTLQATGPELAKYLMFRWEGRNVLKGPTLSFSDVGLLSSEKASASQKGFSFTTLFEGRTAYLQKLHCHLSTLTPGSGYEPHADPYDVAIVVLEGEVETLQRRVVAHSVIFYAEGEPHGMRNVGKKTARYLVFEFHGRKRPLHRRLAHRLRKMVRR
jgi:uncharacterized cupin superfamily protein